MAKNEYPESYQWDRKMTGTIDRKGEVLEGKNIFKLNLLCVPCMVKIQKGKIAKDSSTTRSFLNALNEYFIITATIYFFPQCD